MRIYKRWGKNTFSVKYDFEKEFPEKIILKIKLDKTCKPKLDSTRKRYLRRRYLIKAKDRIMKNTNLSKEEGIWRDYIKIEKKILFSTSRVLVLQCIKENPMGSLDIMNKIRDQFYVKIRYGTVTSILFSLKSINLVNTKIDKGRKLYLLTNKGEIARRALIKDYLNMQKNIEHSFE